MRFLTDEYDVIIGEYYRTINTRALTLRDVGQVFSCRFLGVLESNGGMVALRVRTSKFGPRKGSYFSAVLFEDEWGKSKISWGDLSWMELLTHMKWQCECHCVWIRAADEPGFSIIGVKGFEKDFVEQLAPEKSLIALGPKVPPLEYIFNLIDIVSKSSFFNPSADALLDYDERPTSCWKPRLVSSEEDLNSLVLADFAAGKNVVIQGPPGTGKTYRMAKLAADLMCRGNSVCVTALTNRALMEVAHKLVDLSNNGDIPNFIKQGRVGKTSLATEEDKEIPNLNTLSREVLLNRKGNLSLATFYISSYWAKEASSAHFDYVIVDEASQAYLPMVAASLLLGKQVVWIGDQNQLSPIAQLNGDTIKFHKWESIIAGFNTLCCNFDFPQYMLSDTFRLTKRGAEFTSVFYSSNLSSVSSEQQVPIDLESLDKCGGPVFLPVNLPVGQKCPTEACDRIFDIVKQILNLQPKAEVAILAKFKETVGALQTVFVEKLNKKALPDSIRISTVDSIQGMTVDYCVFLIPNASITYSLEEQLFNVATSRARYSTIIVADPGLLAQPMPQNVRRYLLKLQGEGHIELKPSKPSPYTIDVGSVHIKVVDKIDLDKLGGSKRFPARNLPEGPRTFIIDTNVFYDCPDVLSRIGAPDSAVIPNMVLEELDNLKLKGKDRVKLNQASRNISDAIEKSFAKCESSDVTLLPADFNKNNPDSKILSVALKVKAGGGLPIVVTSDNILQSKAAAVGVTFVSLADFKKRK